MTDYRRNHYVPEWYQYRFLPDKKDERKFFYLDLKPDTVRTSGKVYKRKALLRWGPPRCFYQTDLYTTKFLNWESTEIEQKFFGDIDTRGKKAVEYFSEFEHPSVDAEAFQDLLRYMSIQKLRTPKGLEYLSNFTRTEDKNKILIKMQQLQNMYCALWTECVWQIADAKYSSIKFIVSDHPVTVYNKACFPASQWAEKLGDPEVWLNGTHTYFPLSEEKLLILTNLSWVRHPYGNPTEQRPNPNLFRQSMFNFQDIQTHRLLSDDEVAQINYITKMRARRYLASKEEAWLYPEKILKRKMWSHFGENYLLMPDPRSLTFSTETIIGYKDKSADGFDSYGRRPWQKDYKREEQHEREWETFHAFQGEYARLFGPKRRGRSLEVGRMSNEEDSTDFHTYHLSLEQKFKKHRYKK